MSSITVPSPAKINLFLHVVGRRVDGYHLLQTAFQFIDLVDYLTFQLRLDQEIMLEAVGLPGVPAESNLVFKAAKLLQAYAQVGQGVDIFLEKRIPVGGGLGGGSSNAATTLLVLNHLWNTQLTQEELLELGMRLGADVPIFIKGIASFAEGVGERLETLELPEKWLVLLVPPCTVNTGKIFSDSQLTRTTPRLTIDEFLENGGHNDCESVATKHFPEIANALRWLKHHSCTAKMTGTGGCVFAMFDSEEAAYSVSQEIPESLEGYVVKGLNISPLHDVLKNLIGVSPSGKARGFDLRIPRFES